MMAKNSFFYEYGTYLSQGLGYGRAKNDNTVKEFFSTFLSVKKHLTVFINEQLL